jgi:hypothetical protein
MFMTQKIDLTFKLSLPTAHGARVFPVGGHAAADAFECERHSTRKLWGTEGVLFVKQPAHAGCEVDL